MFEALTEKMTAALRRVQGSGRLSAANIDSALQDVRTALLEADVNVRVAREFLETVKGRVLGEPVPGGLTPGQHFIKLVSDELTRLMGSEHEALRLAGLPPAVVMLVGLQGSGKTSTAGKLAKYLQGEGKRPYLVPADIYRPAAIDQLATLARALDVPCFPATPEMEPVRIARDALDAARAAGADVVLLDTAGRLAIDEEMMAELERVKAAVHPREMLFIADGMSGQDAVNTAEAFHRRLGLTGHILTKMDGDARGGAALALRAVTRLPIKFMAVGEKLDNLERFHPERVASRILGMGDLITLIEKAQQTYDQSQALELQRKLSRNEFTLADFLDQIRALRKLGPMKDLMEMIPGMGAALKNTRMDERELVRVEAIICSMTPRERENFHIVNAARQKRIARGSGTKPADVHRLLKQFAQMRKMMKRITTTGGAEQLMQMMQGGEARPRGGVLN
ncbi:MAG: signal recognition particle protein [Candidatus Lambdaproteobacteria bacterium]|nr:signal recognition particle protein [Candidatus Lambdaproteobacteria bacterium]